MPVPRSWRPPAWLLAAAALTAATFLLIRPDRPAPPPAAPHLRHAKIEGVGSVDFTEAVKEDEAVKLVEALATAGTFGTRLGPYRLDREGDTYRLLIGADERDIEESPLAWDVRGLAHDLSREVFGGAAV